MRQIAGFRSLRTLIALAPSIAFVGSAAAWEWPEAADIVVPANTTANVTADDVAKLAAARTLTIGANSYVYFDHGATPLVLSAAVTADASATMWLRNSAYVVFSGNNENFLGKTYGRSSSTLVVSNRFGLGCAQTKTVDFSQANLLFGGAGLTNDVPIKINVLDTVRRLQVDPAAGTFVQNGDFTDWNTYANLILGNAVFNGNYYQDYGNPGFVSDSTDRDLVFNGPFVSTYSQGWTYGDSKVSGRMHFNASGNDWKSFRVAYNNNVRIICGAANALPPSSYFTIRYRDARTPNSSIDLGGCDQSVLDVRPDYQLENKNQFYEVTSARPATLTLTQTSETAYYSALKFTGRAGLHYAGNGTLQIYNVVSTSKGPLTVSSGTVEFGVYKSGWTGGGWGGDEINVTGGKLLITSPCGILNRNAVVTISGGGTLEVADGVTILVKKLVTSGGEFAAGGDYTVAQLQALGVTGLAGSGSVIVGDRYVDAEKGNDANDGFSPATAKKTLAAALPLARVSGMAVRLAAGTYSNETMTASEENYRAVIPAGVTVFGAGTDKTFIKGHENADDPVRCVCLGANARISDVTLCESYGSAVQAPNMTANKSTAYVVDCVISNNYAVQAAAGNGGSYLRCLIAENSSKSNCCGLWCPDCAVNCVFNRNGMVNDVVEASEVVNCTFISSGTNRQPLYRGTGNCNAYNCVIDRNYSGKVTYKNCLFTERSESDPREAQSSYTDCIYAAGLDTEVDSAFRPVKGHHAGIDRAGARADYERVVASVFGEEELEKDMAGGQRVYNAAIDLGAGEYDARADFSAALNAKNVSVTKATEDVALTAEEKVRLGPGDTLTFALLRQASPKAVEVGFVVEGPGCVKVFANGTRIGTYAAGVQTLCYTPTSANDTLTFVSEGGATAVFDPVERQGGLMLLFR